MKTQQRLRLRPPNRTPSPVYDWGVAWFGSSGTTGHCGRCRQVKWVYQGYNGGAHMGKYCAGCMGPVLRGEP